MLKRVAAVAAGGLVGGALALAGPAQAQAQAAEPVHVEIARHVCEATTFTTSWNTSAQVGNALLVVFDGAEVHTAAIGTPLSVGPFTSPTKVWWRVFGGGERDYDIPLWKGHPATEGGFSLQDFLAGINSYIDVHGDDWVLAGPSDPNPFVTWNYIRLDGCVTPQEPSVTQFDCAVDGNAGELVIPAQEGVRYSHEPGAVPAGDYTVTATAKPGYQLQGQTEWTLSVQPVDDCPDGDDGGDGGDGGDDGKGDNGDDGGAGGVDQDDKPGLPVTSGLTGLPLLLGGGALLVLVGGAAVVFGRRRRPVRLG